MEKNMVRIAGLWKNKQKDGKTYISGNLGGAKILIFENSFKAEDKHPDYTMYLVDGRETPQASSEHVKGKQQTDDDIPF